MRTLDKLAPTWRRISLTVCRACGSSWTNLLEATLKLSARNSWKSSMVNYRQVCFSFYAPSPHLSTDLYYYTITSTMSYIGTCFSLHSFRVHIVTVLIILSVLIWWGSKSYLYHIQRPSPNLRLQKRKPLLACLIKELGLIMYFKRNQ